MTNEDRVLDFIKRHPGRDDDEISLALKITPRQQVNQICNRLLKQGRIRRTKGPLDKLVNTVR